MDDEVLARFAPLVGVVDAGVDESLLEPVAIDGYGGLGQVLFDDREQVTQQSLLGRRQLRIDDPLVGGAPVNLIDPSPRSRNQRRGSTPGGVACAPRIGGLLGQRAAQPPAGGFA